IAVMLRHRDDPPGYQGIEVERVVDEPEDLDVRNMLAEMFPGAEIMSVQALKPA
ncbi:hypothetical protein I3A86_23480, partial [Salmonella enterica]|nr:hypothetical protein [Salmonella enterica]